MTVYIQCTAKLLKKLDHDKHDTVATSPDILTSWHANLLRINRKEYVLFTNDTTLYSICVPKTTKHFFDNLKELFLENLIRSLEHENLQKYVDSIFPKNPQILFVNSTNRRVLSTMNNMTLFIEHFVHEAGGLENINALELNNDINRLIFSLTKYKCPIEYLKELLFKQFETH